VNEFALALFHADRDDMVHPCLKAFEWLKPKIQHPGLTRIHDAGIHEGRFFIVYELAVGSSLKEILEKNPAPWPVEKTSLIIEKIGSALDAAHKNGVVHGELAPREIFLSDDGVVKLLDVGFGQAIQRAGLRYAPSKESEPYRAPEQWTGYNPRVGPSADTWALAVIAYELTTGHNPFKHAVENNDWGEAVRKCHPHPPNLYQPDLPQGTSRILTRALQLRPEDRYGSISEFVKAFRNTGSFPDREGGFDPDLELALETGATLFYIHTSDEISTLEKLQSIANLLERDFFAWRVTSGITRGVRPDAEPPGTDEGSSDARNQPPLHVEEPLGALNWLLGYQKPAILALLDYDIYLHERPVGFDHQERLQMAPGASSWNPPPHHSVEPFDLNDADCHANAYNDQKNSSKELVVLPREQIIRRLKEFARALKAEKGPRRAIIILGSTVEIPQELIKEIQLFTPLPITPLEIESVLREASEWTDTMEIAPEILALEIAKTGSGLSTSEIKDSLRLSFARRGALTPDCLTDLQRNKEQMVRRMGLLELWHPKVTFSDVAGLSELKEWFFSMRSRLGRR
jgi:serine/threonine protein kinase